MGAVTPLRRLIEYQNDDQRQRGRAGRPTDYRPEACDLAEFTLSQGPGFSLISVAVACDVCMSTIKEWQKRHPEFKAAIQRGRLKGLFLAEQAYNEITLKGGLNTVQLQALRLAITNRVRALDDGREEWVNPEDDHGPAQEDEQDLSALTDEELDALHSLTSKVKPKAAVADRD